LYIDQEVTMQTTITGARDRSIFQLTPEELTERLRPTAEAVMTAAWDKDSYVTYYDEQLCADTNYMIHEYKDRKELVKVLDNREVQFVKVI
jgi:hypothetical protein